MSAYTTVDAMTQAFGASPLIQLTDRNHTGEIDEVVIDRAIETASEEIDNALASRYQIPLINPPLTVQTVCQDLAFYNLHRGALISEDARQRYEDAQHTLAGWARGRTVLAGAALALNGGAAPAATQLISTASPGINGGTVWGEY